MEPALQIGERVSVDKGAYASSRPAIGDIVVLHPPVGAVENDVRCGVSISPSQACPRAIPKEDSTVSFIKRVVAGPGDTIFMRGGVLYRNGRPEDTRIPPCSGGGAACDLPTRVKVPAGLYFVLGDNRDASDDSRFWGAVPVSWIVGRVEQ